MAGNTAYSLYGDQDFSQLKANQPVTVRGYQAGNQILVMGSTGGAVTSGTPPPAAPILGAYNVAVMVAYFSDTINPFNMPQIQAAFNPLTCTATTECCAGYRCTSSGKGPGTCVPCTNPVSCKTSSQCCSGYVCAPPGVCTPATA